MNKLYRSLCLTVLLLAGSLGLPLAAQLSAFQQAIANHQYFFRLVSHRGHYAYEHEDHSVTCAPSSGGIEPLSALWLIETSGDGYRIRNAQSARFLPGDGQADVALTTRDYPTAYYIKDSHLSGKLYISWDRKYGKNTALHEAGDSELVKWHAQAGVDHSCWTLESVTDESLVQQAKTMLAQKLNYQSSPSEGQYYRLVNREYLGRSLGENISGNNTYAFPTEVSEYTQLWTLVPNGTRWTLRNAVTDRSIGSDAVRSSAFTMGSNTTGFTLQAVSDAPVPTFIFQGTRMDDTRPLTLHASSSQGYQVVAWYGEAPASLWHLVPVEVDDNALQAARANYGIYVGYNGQTAVLTEKLRTYFTTDDCTDLRETYAGGTAEQLRSAMEHDALPEQIMVMAEKIRGNTWSYREREFRAYDYTAYSEPNAWKAQNLLWMNFSFSPQTNPTGIQVRKNEPLFVFVGDDLPAGTTLHLMNCNGFEVMGARHALQRGFNMVMPDRNGHLFLDYRITDTSKTLASTPKISVHIEGGEVVGCFDLTRGHTNTTYLEMRNNGLLTADVLHLKSVHTQVNVQRDEVLRQNPEASFAETDLDGSPKAIEGALKRLDWYLDTERSLMGIEQYKDRWNSMLSVSTNSTSSPYAHTYGIWCTDASPINYEFLSRGEDQDNGRGRWAVAHEFGHHHQAAINLIGDTECSVNFFSQVLNWRMGSNVGRGLPLQNSIDSYLSGTHRCDYDIWQRSRMYFQLWLYFHELGHKPTFYPELFAAFRADNMNWSSGTGTENDLKFAVKCSQIAGEDLSEFFELYGFFVPVNNKTINDYGIKTLTTTPEQVAAAKAEMAKLPKRIGGNLFFLDERIEPTKAHFFGEPLDRNRYSMTTGVIAGNPGSVGDVGMYTLFAQDATSAQPADVRLVGRIVSVAAGTGAVGYKVYDATGKLVFLSNKNTFTLPEQIDLSTARVVVASGNGQDVTVIENGQVKPEYAGSFKNLAGLLLSTDPATPEYLYEIQNTRDRAYYADAQTRPSTTERGSFAFFAGVTDGTYYIQETTSGQWLTYSLPVAQGKDKVKLVDSQSAAKVWQIAAETADQFDIFPADITAVTDGNAAWNAFGGIMGTFDSMGFYGHRDDGSSWRLLPANAAAQGAVAIAAAREALSHEGAGYPTAEATVRRQLTEALAAYEGNATADALQTLNAAVTAFRSADRDLLMPEDGKVYRIRHFYDGRVITNASTMEGTTRRTLSMSTATDNTALWICQQVEGGYRFASATGSAFLHLIRQENGQAVYRGATTEQPTIFTVGHGSQFGALYLRANSASFSASQTRDYVEAVNATVSGNGSNAWGTDFFLDEVEDFSFPVQFREGANGSYATTHLPFATVLPEGVTAYALNPDMANERVLLTPLNLRVLPALTPVLLKSATASRQRLIPAPHAAPLTTGMEGTLGRRSNESLAFAEKTYYALTLDEDNRFAFWRIEATGIPANRAFFTVEGAYSAGSTQAFGFDFSTITHLDAAPQAGAPEAPVYDLSGRRIHRLLRGQMIIRQGRPQLVR